MSQATLNVENGAELPKEPNHRSQTACEIVKQVEQDVDEMRLDGLIGVSGKSYLVHLTSMYWGVRGIPEQLGDLAWSVLLFELGVPSARGNILQAMVFTPWAMKPLFGIVSDLFPVFHYRKRFYMSGMLILGAAAAGMILFSTNEQLGGKTASVAFIWMFFIQSAIAMCDSLSQGQYSEVCKAKGAAVVSFTYASKNAAYGIAALIGPYFSQRFSSKVSFGIMMPLFGQAAAITGLNFMGDKREEQACSPRWDIMTKDRKIVFTGLFLGLWALGLALLEIAGVGYLSLPVGIVGLFLVIGITFWSLPKSIAVINVYILLCRVMTLDFRYALLQWYTSPVGWCDETPHFPLVVYQTMGYVLGSIATLFGVWLFQNYVYHWNIRAAFWVTTLFTTIAALFDLSMLSRFNRTVFSPFPFIGNTRVTWFLGKLDYPVRLDDLMGFLIGTQALKPIATTLDEMPATVMLSKLCPPGVETTVFAMLAAMQNLGLQLSGLLGAWALQQVEFNIENQTNEGNVDEPFTLICNEGNGILGFNGIQTVLIIGGIILPLLTIPVTFILLPNRRLDDNFIDEDLAPTEDTPNRAADGTLASDKSYTSVAANEAAILTQASWMAQSQQVGSRLF